MKMVSRTLGRFCFAICLSSLMLSIHVAAATTFELLPGSTITLSNGPTESLSGVFTWQSGEPFPIGGELYPRYDVTALHLESASTSFTLSETMNVFLVVMTPNGLNATRLALAGYADMEGWSDETVYMNEVFGIYGGSQVSFPNVSVLDSTRTVQLGSISFSAMAVPEPSSATLCGIALVAGGLLRRLRS